jgi:predicted transglutaminase-like cysteine proteinase
MEVRLNARATSLRVLMIVVAAAFCSTPSVAEDKQLYTVPVAQTQTPKQWQEFCKHHPADCKSAATAAMEVKLTLFAWLKLIAINRTVNGSIMAKTDQAHWHVEDRWDYPDDGYGDCEDYALLKRRRLIEAGFPAGALMLTVVWTEQNHGHAVLLVRTDSGDLALDSERTEILHWTRTGYRFVKRQRAARPNDWVYIDGVSPGPALVSTSSRRAAAVQPN